ncbi:MAG TPA: kelch repeat-containing protein, partial [Anaeromyxobacteraceae bacterium]|nr:kelch repeat-containing protein [Anaeromyxobacteraceae bacterium]
ALGDPGDNWPVVASAVLYDPVQRLFVPTGSLATARASHTATLLPDGKVLVAGGAGYETSGTLLLLASAELYDPELGTFTPTGSLPVPCDSHTATLLPSGRVLIAGGECLEGSYGPGETSALYDPASGVFAPSGNLLTAREFHTATVLPPGRDVLIAGGAYWDIPSSAELYESATGAFLATGSMTVDRRFHTATLLPTGKVLFTGGETTSDRWSGIFTMSGPDLASAELYDPSLGVFTPTEQLATGRSGHTATLLLSGDVLIVGGSANGYPLASVEMYDPVAEAFVRR